ncbi:MAG TPA: Xaa-Pro peptidase family protein [Acidimicrobiales bacterium]|nr:Xaa-Pro peptidase family protein [Acidimicrobiales bacterium]
MPDGPGSAAGLPSMDVPGRLARLRAGLQKAGCGALLVTHLVNIRYLTGFTGSAAKLFVTPDDAVLVTDGRYREQAALEMDCSGGARLVVAGDADQWTLLGELARKAGKVGLEADHVSWGRQMRLAGEWAPECELVAARGLVEELRLVKDDGEIARVQAAAGVADRALQGLLSLLGERPTEAEFALALDSEMRRLGATKPAFDTIVACGPGGAEPHHQPGARRIEVGDVVVVDFGAEVAGYRSDMTRTLVAGSGAACGGAPSVAWLGEAMAVVTASQESGLAAVRPGVCAAEVDAACRAVLERAGMGELLVHGTGHGVGLDIHEAPWLSAPSTDILQAGQVITVEPGVYLPGVGGARTEDTVVVTEDGCRALTLAPK